MVDHTSDDAQGSLTQEDIYANCWTTLIGFSEELTERDRKFICDQVARKVILAAQPPAAPVETRKTFTVPPGYEAVRDGEGRATGEVRPQAHHGSSAGTASEHHAPEVFLFYRDKQLHHIHTDRKVFETWMEKSAWNYPADRCEIVRYVPDVPQAVPVTDAMINAGAAALFGDGWDKNATPANRRYCREKAQAIFSAMSSLLLSLPAPQQVPVTAQEHLQSRGRHYDIIKEAIAAYDEYMLDDDYDAQGTLNNIIKKMRERVELSDAPSSTLSRPHRVSESAPDASAPVQRPRE